MTELKSLPVWVCWDQAGWEKAKAENKPDDEIRKYKKPLNAKTGGNAMPNNPATWATIEQAESAAPRYGGGIGFMFTGDYVGIDIDKVVGDPAREAMAAEIVSLFDSYTEYSPSATGYHIVIRADIKQIPQRGGKLDDRYYAKNSKRDLECYIAGLTNRYFTATFEAVNDRDIEERTPQLLQFLDKYMKRNPPQRANASTEGLKKDAAQNVLDVLSIARRARNGNKFSSLFDQGDLSRYNGDDSSADIALCNYLAFYCQGDYAEVDRYFRQSALYRAKWEREDYRDATIGKAIALCNGKYYRPPGRPKKARPDGEAAADQRDSDSREDKITIEGVAAYLRGKGVSVRYNVINHTVDIAGVDARYSLEHLADLLPIIAYDELKLLYKSCPKDDVRDAIQSIADIDRYNPVLDMLNAATWDGRDRLPELFGILGLTDADRLSKVLVYKWLWQCLSMARNDLAGAYGADGILCLVGPQGIGKTSLLRKLAVKQEFFYEGQHINFNDKDTSRRASSSWICELGEVESTLRSDIEKLKAYITAATDMYRLPYGRADVHLARRTSLCATANSDQYLIDPSGNRRFCTVTVADIDLAALDKFDALQLWAQVDAKTKHDRQGFRLKREEQQTLNERNDLHEKPIKAESEIRDIFDMAEGGGKNLTFRYVTVTEFKGAHESLRNYGVDAISKALSKMGVESEKRYIEGKQQRLRRLPVWKQFGEAAEPPPDPGAWQEVDPADLPVEWVQERVGTV